jgi:undecaprenyl phosphate N,N'-diacetylbacillosamine 1-phosphate transferase
MLVLTVLLCFQNKGRPFFTQERPGYRERPFRLIKFKSMTDERDAQGQLLPDNQRLTPLGAFIRKASLDELPQLFNVLKGEMSLVGPRPLLFKYPPLLARTAPPPRGQARHHRLGQVNGRNSISSFRHDLYYIENQSLTLDIKILWLTVLKVFRREGVNQSAERPMEPFNGTN